MQETAVAEQEGKVDSQSATSKEAETSEKPSKTEPDEPRASVQDGINADLAVQSASTSHVNADATVTSPLSPQISRAQYHSSERASEQSSFAGVQTTSVEEVSPKGASLALVEPEGDANERPLRQPPCPVVRVDTTQWSWRPKPNMIPRTRRS